ncbi:hypothetical protein TNCT_262581, partial [Trichonephila clavata]
YITNCKARVGKMKSNLDSKGKYHVPLLTTNERRQYRATASKQLMGDLPGHRVTPSRPFSVCGADYAGPINVLRYRGEVSTSSSEHTNDYILFLRSCWDSVQKMKLGFRRKWKVDYLSNLQNRTKWKYPNNNFKVSSSNLAIGKVIETHSELDDIHVSKILQEDNFCITDMDMEWFRLWNIYKSLTQNNSTFEVVKV